MVKVAKPETVQVALTVQEEESIMINENTKRKIDALSVFELLATARLAPIGDPRLEGEEGKYRRRRLAELRRRDYAAFIAASKSIGWQTTMSKNRTNMNNMRPIPISAAKRIAKDYGYHQVIVIARRVGEAPEQHGEYMTTYGVDKTHCNVAARVGSFLQRKVMGWEDNHE